MSTPIPTPRQMKIPEALKKAKTKQEALKMAGYKDSTASDRAGEVITKALHAVALTPATPENRPAKEIVHELGINRRTLIQLTIETAKQNKDMGNRLKAIEKLSNIVDLPELTETTQKTAPVVNVTVEKVDVKPNKPLTEPFIES